MTIEECQNQLRLSVQYQKILARILARIRASVPIESLCSTSCQDICRQLQIERVAIYQFNADWSGSFINQFGFAEPPWDALSAFGKDLVWQDSYLQETEGGRYRKNEPFAVADIYEAGHAHCHVEVLEQFQIQAYAIAPIFVGTKLWGLLAAYQHSAPRQWHPHEVTFLAQAGNHLGVAMQQAETLKQAEQRNVELQDAISRQRALTQVVGNIRSSVDTHIILDTACQELCKLLKLERAAVYRFNEDWSGEFVSQFGIVEPLWDRTNPFGKNLAWEDTHLQETQGGRYRNNESFAVVDIYQAGHTRCHLDILEQFKIRAYVLAPIFTGTKLWGLVAAYQHSSPRQWQAFEVEFLEQVGAQLGVAIQQAENLEQSRQQAIALQDAIARQRALTEVVGKIRSSLDINLILKMTCQEVCNLLRVERIAVYRFNDDWSGEFISNFGMVEPQWDSINPFGENLVWQDTHLQETKGGRYRNNESFAVSNIYQVGHSRCHLDILEQFKIRAYALTPIFVGRNLWGLLAAYQHSGTRHWDAVEVEFLAQVASQLGVALQSSDLLMQTQIRADELHQAAEQRRILFDLVVKIRESFNWEPIVKPALAEVRRVLDVDRVGILRFEPDSGYCSGEFIAEDVLPNLDSALNTKVHDRFGQQHMSQFSQRTAQVISDTTKLGAKLPYFDVIEWFQVKAQITVPLMEGDTLWGLLCIHQCSKTREWEETELEFVTQVAAQINVALLQASLFHQSSLLGQTREEADQLAQALRELRAAQLQIIHAEKMASLGQLVAGIAHEINNPVNFIYGNLEHAEQYIHELLHCVNLYRQHYSDPAPQIQQHWQNADLDFTIEDLPKLFQSMTVGTERIRDIVMSLRNFSRLDEAEFKSVDIHEGIDSTLMILQHRLKPTADSPTIQVIKDYDALPTVECYPGQLNQVFMNLLSNAIHAVEERNAKQPPSTLAASPGEIRISTSVIDQDWVSIRVSDNGLGIDESVLSKLFDPFFTTKITGKGTGLGLSISYQIVTEKHNGKIYCHSTPGMGAEFVVELPIHQPLGS
ncbi:MAG: GAF domain-containing protein [Myxacorys californica WJT36-NPBG1]|jgi:hypothetical protein|nr:GAF domain-containing protein [Myxacorys californica WJT36-NPBG1]